MINILIVDDDALKAANIAAAIHEALTEDPHKLEIKVNVIEAKNALCNTYFDLLIIDLVLPYREGDQPVKSSGAELIREIPLIASYKKPGTIIGVTAYSDAYDLFLNEFDQQLWYLLTYDASSQDWKRKLQTRLRYLVASRKNSTDSGYQTDLGIVTALYNPELMAVLKTLQLPNEVMFEEDESIYFKGEIRGKRRNLSAVAACARQMGMTATCALAMKMISHFRPRYLLMCGISAGFKTSQVGIGDILLCDESWNYDSGKRVVVDGVSRFEPDPRHIALHTSLPARLQQLVGEQSFVAKIQSDWLNAKPITRLKVWFGPVVSGSSVVADPAIPATIRASARTVLGLEMETYGLMYAAQTCCNPRPVALSLKSVCDFADTNKGDDFQDYAAFTSSNYLSHLASTGIFE